MLEAHYPGANVFGGAIINESKKWALLDKRATKGSQRTPVCCVQNRPLSDVKAVYSKPSGRPTLV